MRKESLFAGLLALLLVFALLGCEQVTSGGGVGSGADPNDKWTEVTSLDGLDGTWKSSVTANMDGGAATLVTTMTYPASGQNEDGAKVDNGVRVDSSFIVDGKVMDSMVEYYSKDDYESIYMRAEDTSMYINQSKTRIKMESVDTDPHIATKDNPWKPVETDEEWEQFQKQMLEERGGEYSGDMTVTFSAGAPYTMTTTQIFHKQ